MKTACVITIDLRESRKLPNRAAVQRKTLQLLHTLNKKFSNALLADFTMTLGDEFQGVLKTPKQTLEIFNLTKSSLTARFYCGVGVGTITTSISKKPSEMDGPAFHRSRHALKEAKKEKMELVIRTRDEKVDELLNTLIQLILHIKNKWTAKQKEVTAYFELNPNTTQSEAAKHFKISKQAISKTLKLTGWKKTKKAEVLLKDWLEKLPESKPETVDQQKSTKKG